MMAYHRSDDITIDLMATAIDMMAWPPHLDEASVMIFENKYCLLNSLVFHTRKLGREVGDTQITVPIFK